MRWWPQASHASTWPPRTAVRHVSIAVITRPWLVPENLIQRILLADVAIVQPIPQKAFEQILKQLVHVEHESRQRDIPPANGVGDSVTSHQQAD